MASSFEQQLAQINGIVIPSPLAAGQQPVKPRMYLSDTDNARTKRCPICGHTSTQPHHIRRHFVTCVKANGNPTGARWDDGLNFVPRPQPHLPKQEQTDNKDNMDIADTKQPARFTRTKEQRDERQRRFYQRLDAVNGIVVPSKLAPGEQPVRKICETGDSRKFTCPVCGSLHNLKGHVKSHFATCVETNGNPLGARWDDAWNGPAAGRAEPLDEKVSRNPPVEQMPDPQPEESESPCVQSAGFVAVNVPRKRSSQRRKPLFTPPTPGDSEPYTFDLLSLHPKPKIPSAASTQPYDPYDPMAALIREALLSTDQEWQGVIFYGGETYAMRHPFFQQTLKELECRDMLQSDWVGVVEIEKVEVGLMDTTS